MSSIPPPKGGGGLKPPGSKIGVAKAGGLKAGLLAKSGKTGATPAPPSRQQSSADLSRQQSSADLSRQQSSADLTKTEEFKGWELDAVISRH